MRTGIVLMSDGAPDRADQAGAFLGNQLGRLPSSAEVRDLQNRLERIGGGSPLLETMRRQATALSEVLRLRVYVGMRCWEPSIYGAVAQARPEGIGRLVGVALTPHYAESMVGRYHAVLREAAPDMEVIPLWSWAMQPQLIRYWADRLSPEATAICTAPAVRPESVGLFRNELQSTIRAIRKRVPFEAHLAFHTVGDARMDPGVEEMIKRLRLRDELTLVPIGFVADHVEILYDLDVAAMDLARRLGVKATRVPAPNDDPHVIAALAGAVRAVLEGYAHPGHA